MVNRYDRGSQLTTLWHALDAYREDCISGDEYNAQWDDLCTIMVWLEEDLEQFDSLDAMIDYKERHDLA
jgi:hypothetical protein